MSEMIGYKNIAFRTKDIINCYIKAKGFLKVISLPLLLDSLFIAGVLIIRAINVFYELWERGGLLFFVTGIPVSAVFFLLYIAFTYINMPNKAQEFFFKKNKALTEKNKWIITLGIMISFRVLIAIILSIYTSVLG
jgi:hypothetical protein